VFSFLLRVAFLFVLLKNTILLVSFSAYVTSFSREESYFWRFCRSFTSNFGILLGGKTCCAFDCTPNVDTAIEDKIRDKQKATLQATRVIHACRKESLFFLQTNWTKS
jgi:hypothetical protein